MEFSTKSYFHVLGYSFAALLGVIGANYIDGYVSGFATGYVGIGEIVAGLLIVAIPVLALHKNEGIYGALRILIGVAGTALVFRGVISQLGIALPAQVQFVQ